MDPIVAASCSSSSMLTAIPHATPLSPSNLRLSYSAASPRIRRLCFRPRAQIAVTVGPSSSPPQDSDSSGGGRRIKNIVVVGGGTAGWMSASYIAKALGSDANVTLLQAPEISTLGVGEASIPDLQSVFFDFLDIPESVWMRECRASFKTAVKYINWRTEGSPTPMPRPCSPDAAQNMPSSDYFYNLFLEQPHHEGLPLWNYWVERLHDKSKPPLPPYMYACFHTAPALDAKRSPRLLDGTPAFPAAWHFDAHLVADFLRRHSTTKLGVHHVQEKMVSVEMNPDRPGHIQALHTVTGRRIPADLFIDATGFRGVLINGALEEPFLRSDHLLCDSAVAAQVPHDDATHGVEPYTSAIAMDAGWTWKIPLPGRFGSGYVYSSAFSTEEKAAEDFCRLWGLNAADTKLNKIRFRVGKNRRAWVGNVVSIGAASCFLEPLESTGIYFIYTALYHLLDFFPDKDFRPGCTAQFNYAIDSMFSQMQDFLQMHYCFSTRRDTEFWRASAELEKNLSPRAERLVEAYRAGLVMFPEREMGSLPSGDGGDGMPKKKSRAISNPFTNSHFFHVLAGAGLLPDCPNPRLAYHPDAVRTAQLVFDEIQRRQEELLLATPSLHDYLCHLHGGAAASGTTAGAGASLLSSGVM